ncbi:MAG: N-acetylneuraminate synthase family protein [Candidatus Paceibacterota bacterium]|jgi:N-acetylneuraminate synthase/N,N'-diacetyllegionaminate synthase
MQEIKIGNRLVGDGQPCFIIAEAGVNHNGSLDLAKKLIDAAKEAGADAVKFQTFKTEGVMIENVPMAEYQKKNTGKKETMFQMVKRLELDYNSFVELKKYCDQKGILFLSTPHSEDAIDFLDQLIPAFKTGSGDLTNFPALEKIAQKGKPTILSTGMATLDEVGEGIEAIKSQGNNEIILLHCTTNYPCPIEDVNLRAMFALSKKFNLLTGYSDHTQGINVSLAAVALGACVIEKHFTTDKNLPGPDHKASVDPKELKAMVMGIRNIENRLAKGDSPDDIVRELDIIEALGDGVKNPTPSELEIAKLARKSIVAAVDISKGEIIGMSMLAIKRPGTGIKPKYLSRIIGIVSKENIKKDELITWEKVQ